MEGSARRAAGEQAGAGALRKNSWEGISECSERRAGVFPERDRAQRARLVVGREDAIMKCPEGEGVRRHSRPARAVLFRRAAPDASTGRRPMSSWPLAARVTGPASCHFWGYLRPAGESIDRRIRGSRRMALMMGVLLVALRLC